MSFWNYFEIDFLWRNKKHSPTEFLGLVRKPFPLAQKKNGGVSEIISKVISSGAKKTFPNGVSWIISKIISSGAEKKPAEFLKLFRKQIPLAHDHLGMIINLFHVTGKLQVICWSVVLGFWLLVFGLRALGFGRLSLVFELGSVVVGLRSFVFEIPDENFSRRL